MAFLNKALVILSALIAGISAALPASYDVAWTTPGVNGSADSMPLGGGDIGINTWFENGKLTFVLSFKTRTSRIYRYQSPVTCLPIVIKKNQLY
jgi:hypothetical protein